MPVLSNARHERFAQEVAKGKTYSEAYELAGYQPNDGNASTLANKPAIAERIKEIKGAAAEKAGVTVERIMAELAKIGFSNMLDYVKVDGEGQPQVNLAELSRDQAAAIGEIVVNTRTERVAGDKPDAEVQSVRFKLLDKRAALVDLGKHLGMFKERVEHTGKDGGPIQTEEISDTEAARRVAFMLSKASQGQQRKDH